MCGICGAVGDFDRETVRAMADTLAHRGPDDEGFWFADGIGLGHRRLSIIDLSNGHQPLSNEDGTVWISFNGEIYNHRELRARLEDRHHFATRCDTEVIVHLYEELGPECVHELRGMFAFAIWDTHRRRLVLARDRFGIKPLYWTRTSGGLAFASEVKALTAAGVVCPEVDEEALPSYLDYRYVTGDRTLFDGVRRLEPGHVLTLEDDRLEIRRYWRLGDAAHGAPELDEVEAVEEFLRLLREAVEIRLMSEVPLGAFLSGGLDSSLIVALMSEVASEPVRTFTASLEGDWHDEAPHARVVAEAFGTIHTALRVDASDADLLDRVVWHLDEPVGDAATLPTFLLSELTRRDVTVVLTGEGADELLGGYPKYKAFKYGSWLRRLVGGPHFGLLSRLGGLPPNLARGAGFLAHRDPVAAYRHLSNVFTDEEKARLAGPRLRGRLGDPGPVDRAFGSSDDPVERLMSLDIDTWLPNDVLLKVDKMSMAHSLEARVPFLDHVLAEFLVSLPSRLKLRGSTEKYLLRRAMRPLVPEEITRRRKHGFTVPIHRWLEGRFARHVDAALAPARVRELGFWDPDQVTGLRRADTRNDFVRRQLVALVVFDRWHRVFIEGRRPAG